MGKSVEKVHYKDAPIVYRTDIEGWVSPDGRFWGASEHLARKSSCDVVDCGTHGCSNHVRVSSFNVCDDCREVNRRKRYAAFEVKPWGGNSMVYSMSHDRYFDDAQDVFDYCQSSKCEAVELELVHCRPIHMSTIDEDNLAEELHEDAELPSEIHKALKTLNEMIQRHGKNISWMPSDVAVSWCDK